MALLGVANAPTIAFAFNALQRLIGLSLR